VAPKRSRCSRARVSPLIGPFWRGVTELTTERASGYQFLRGVIELTTDGRLLRWFGRRVTESARRRAGRGLDDRPVQALAESMASSSSRCSG
jgi:hypothetical protein